MLRHIDLELHAGEIIGVAGDESSGKTALLQCAAGLLSHDSGEITWFGDSVGRNGAVQGVEFVPAVPEYYPFLTVRDVLELRASRAATDVQGCLQTVDETMLWLGLANLERCPVMRLSRAEQKHLAVAESMVANPRALLIDGSPSDTVSFAAPVLLRTLSDFALRGGAVMIAARELSCLKRIASRCVMVADGIIADTRSLQDLPMPRFVAERVH